MKKLFISIICVLTVFAANAQDWYLGPQASLNLTGLTHPAGISTGTRAGYAIGAFGGYEFNKLIGIEGQITYSSQGCKFKDANGTMKMNYINVPVMAKFNVWKGINLFVGPQFGFNVRAKHIVNGNTLDMKDSVKTFDFGAIFGAAYQFDFGLRAGISYYAGMVNTSQNDNTSKNKVFAITVGWRF